MAVGAPQHDACQIPSTNQNSGRSPPLHRRAPNVSRAGSVGLSQRMSPSLSERRTSTAHRGQYKAQRRVGAFIVIDIENFLRSSKTLHQGRELTPVAQTVDFESN